MCKEKNVVLVDDMVDYSGETFDESKADLMRSVGALSVRQLLPIALLSGDAYEKIEKSQIIWSL